jgi:hypothetical protein
MKPGRRRNYKAKTPKEIADQFREWQRLRIKITKGELATAVDVETKVEGNDRSPRKPGGSKRLH